MRNKTLRSFSLVVLTALALVVMPVKALGVGAIGSNHFEGGKNLTKGSKHGTAGTLAELIMDLQASAFAGVEQTITNGDTTHTSSSDAIFDALALKLNSSALVQTITNGDTTHTSSSDALFDALALEYDATNVAEATFSATFDNAVGAKTVVVRKMGKTVTLEIPTGTTADAGGGAIASGAGDVTLAYRPAADLSFPVVVTTNAAKVFGRLVVSSAGTLTFTTSAAGGNFTDNATGGFDRVAVTYTLP